MSELIFREFDHTYWLDGRLLVSVTQLLDRQHLTTDLSNAPVVAVRRAGEHGTLVHDEIDNFIKTGEMGISDEFQDFLRLVYPLADRWESEVMVHTDYYAGRVDLVGYRNDQIVVIVDTKTGTLNVNATAWQVSLYANALHASENVALYAFDAKMNGNSRLVPLLPVSKACIDALIDADSRCEIYNPVGDLITAQESSCVMLEQKIADMEKELKALKASRDEFWANIKAKMEEGRIMSLETPSFRLTYVAPYSKTIVNTEMLKSKYPKVFEDCQKTSVVGASLRVKVKEA